MLTSAKLAGVERDQGTGSGLGRGPGNGNSSAAGVPAILGCDNGPEFTSEAPRRHIQEKYRELL
jgi:hypothetical protein